MPDTAQNMSADAIAADLRAFLDSEVARIGGPQPARNPGHRVSFQWPPHSISSDYHVLSSDWTGHAEFDAYGEKFDVRIARTANGVFGRCEKLWHEARGSTLEEVLKKLESTAEPLFRRQFLIGKMIGFPGRFTGTIRELPPSSLVRLLYCSDRDIANEAQIEIETHASLKIFSQALIEVLRDDRHPDRRIAQWCVLDLFEDLPSFCPEEQQQDQAVEAIRGLILNSTDDFARTVYKAGVVLGGHVCTRSACEALFDCAVGPSRIGRRSAIHALFHLAEWKPEWIPEILEKLNDVASNDSETMLREFAKSMARDIEAGETDHMTEPVFDDEP